MTRSRVLYSLTFGRPNRSRFSSFNYKPSLEKVLMARKQQVSLAMQKEIIRLFFDVAMKYKVQTVSAIVGGAFTAIVAGFVGPYIISLILEAIQARTISMSNSSGLIVLYVAAQLWGEVIGWRLNMFLAWSMETAAQRDLYHRIFSQLTNQSLSFHSDRFGGALVSQTTKLIGSFERFWDTIIFSIGPSIASILAATIILGMMLWQYAIFLAVLSIVFGVTVVLGSRFMAERNKDEAQASTAANAHVADAVTNVMTIKSYGRERDELAAMNEKTDIWRRKSLYSMKGLLSVSTLYSSLLAITNITALVMAIWASDSRTVSVGVVYLAVTYTFTVVRQLWEINNIMRNYNRIMGDAHDMTEILGLKPSVIDHSHRKLKVTRGDIAIKSITFAHEGNRETLFNDFSLTIRHGERVGLVGQSGSGKTTLTKLLLRFADVSQGSLLIDGQDIAHVTQESLRKNIAYVPQEPMLFHRTLRENIAYGKPNATDEEILNAATLAHAIDFITSMPKGLDTLVGERGVKLSGGQRQRIAIARAILKDAPILVLDEATSALDSESEKLIQNALERLMKGRTSLVIAHRLSTISNLDRIIVMKDGEIIEDGSHSELLAAKGQYSRLWTHQSGGFIET